MRRLLAAVAALLAFVSVAVVPGADAQRGTDTTTRAVAYMPGTWIVQLRDGVDAETFLATHGIPNARAYVYRSIFPGFSADLSSREIAAVVASPEVVSVEPDQVIQQETTQTVGPTSGNIPNSGVLPWGLDLIDQRSMTPDGAYTYTQDGTGVKVYVLDTGINALHSDFGARVADGWSYRATSSLVTNAWTNLGSCKNVAGYRASDHPYDVDTFDNTPDATDKGKSDNEGHGTHVAGIIGGSLTGVAKNVTIVPVRILNSCGEGTTTMANAGLDWIITDHTNGQKAVVNMSIGFPNRPSSFENRVTSLLSEGVTVVAAAGNDPATDPCTTAPAATNGTVSVAAVGSSVKEASYSAYGDCVDIFAPGGTGYVNGGVNSTWNYLSTEPSNSSTYMNESGTSMAAPHVAGAVALYLQANSLPADVSTTPSAVWAWLKKQSTCGLVTYASSTRTTQSANRFLNIGSAASVPCAPTGITKTQEAGRSTIAWTELPSPNGSDITGYQVTTSPATPGCSTNASTFTCALTGLTDGTTYTVSVQATNGVGAGAAGTITLVSGTSGVATTTTTTTIAPTTTTTVPVTTTTEAPATTTTAPPPPTTVPAVTASPSNPVVAFSSTKSLLLSWPAITSSEPVTYVVSVTPGGVSCTTSNTSCTFLGVSLGTVYNFSIVARTPSGQTSVALRYSVTAGVNQKVFSVRTKSRTVVTKLVSTVSKGARTYKVTSGKCRISTGRLVAPASPGVCKVKVTVARYRTYRAMTSTVTVQVL